FANITVPEDWKREERTEGERRITEWTTPDGAVTVRYVVESVARDAGRTVSVHRGRMGSEATWLGSLQDAGEKHTLFVRARDEGARERALSTIGAYNPRLGRWIASATPRREPTHHHPPTRYPRRVF
ncbi:MAG: hypothetical protein D6776_06235, partial [Planctomycetota bacterium]